MARCSFIVVCVLCLLCAPLVAQLGPASLAGDSPSSGAVSAPGGRALSLVTQSAFKVPQPSRMSVLGKFGSWARNSYSPRIFASGALTAGIPVVPREPVHPIKPAANASAAAWDQYDDAMNAYGDKMDRFRQVMQEELRSRGRRFGAGLAESETRSFASNFLIPALVHQDPRYFRADGRSKGYRLAHALASVVIARSDAGHTMPNFGVVGGTFAAAGAARWYNRQLNVAELNSNQHFMKSVGFNLGFDAVENVVREFCHRTGN